MSTRTLLSIEEFERLPEPEQGGGYELDEGEAVYVSPNSYEQAEIIQRIYAPLKAWAHANNRGLVASDAWFEHARGVVRAPDVAYVPRDRVSPFDPKHALKLVPALAVGVLSPLNTAREVSRKIQQYRDAGVELIWVVDPEKSEVDVHSALPLRTLRQGDALKDAKVLPGISISVSDVFAPIV